MKLTLKRSGMFKCNWSDYDNRCGIDRQPVQEYKYECEIETDAGLDEHGFIVDQLDVNKIMQGLYYPDPHKAQSCEKIAMSGVFKMLDLVIMQSVAKPYRIRVGVGAIPPKNVNGEAMIYAEWTA